MIIPLFCLSVEISENFGHCLPYTRLYTMQVVSFLSWSKSTAVWWSPALRNLACFHNVIKWNLDPDVIFDKCLLMKVFGVIFFKYVNVLFKFDQNLTFPWVNLVSVKKIIHVRYILFIFLQFYFTRVFPNTPNPITVRKQPALLWKFFYLQSLKITRNNTNWEQKNLIQLYEYMFFFNI